MPKVNASRRRKQSRSMIRAVLRAPKRLENFLDTELRRFQIEVEAGNYVRLEKTTFEAFVEKWISRFVNVDLEEKTKDNLSIIPAAAFYPISAICILIQIKTMHINDYMGYLRTPAARLDGKGKPLDPQRSSIITGCCVASSQRPLNGA